MRNLSFPLFLVQFPAIEISKNNFYEKGENHEVPLKFLNFRNRGIALVNYLLRNNRLLFHEFGFLSP